MDKKAEAKVAWDMFHEAVRRLDAVCMADNVTLKLSIPTLGATKKKVAALKAKSQSDAEVKPP